MEIKINIEKRHFFVLLGAILLMGVVFGVGAFNPGGTGGNPAVMGHSVDEMDWSKPINANLIVNGLSASGEVSGTINPVNKVPVVSVFWVLKNEARSYSERERKLCGFYNSGVSATWGTKLPEGGQGIYSTFIQEEGTVPISEGLTQYAYEPIECSPDGSNFCGPTNDGCGSYKVQVWRRLDNLATRWLLS